MKAGDLPASMYICFCCLFHQQAHQTTLFFPFPLHITPDNLLYPRGEGAYWLFASPCENLSGKGFIQESPGSVTTPAHRVSVATHLPMS